MKEKNKFLCFPLALCHLLALWALIVAQPLYELIYRNPEFLSVRRVSATHVLSFVLVISVISPLTFSLLLYVLSKISRRYGAWLLLFYIFVLTGLFSFLTLRRLELHLPLEISAGIFFGCLGAILYARSGNVRTFITLLTPALLLIPAFFLFQKPIFSLLKNASHARPATGGRTDTPVVLITFDELPLSSLTNANGEIDKVHFPHFAALADTSIWYTHAAAVAGETTNALPAILTGTFPEKEKLSNVSDYPGNIFTALSASFDMRVLEPITSLCPSEVCGGEAQSFRSSLTSLLADSIVIYLHRILTSELLLGLEIPAINMGWGEFGGKPSGEEGILGFQLSPEQILSQFRVELQKPVGDKPPFAFLHILLPHPPWRYFPDGKEYSSPDRVIIEGLKDQDIWEQDEPAVDFAYFRHLLQLEFTDTALGQIVSDLKANGMFDRALLLVTADHGGSFRPGGHRRELSSENEADILPVPLFIKLPKQESGRIDSRLARSIDIVPTIADVLSLKLSWTPDGRSLLADPLVDMDIRFLKLSKEVVSVPKSVLDSESSRNYKKAAVERINERTPLWCNDCRFENLHAAKHAAPLRCTARILGSESFQQVKLDTAVLPAFVRGKVQCGAGVSPPQEVVLFLNGMPFAKTTLRKSPLTGLEFTALAPNKMFREANNEIGIEGVFGDGRGVIFRSNVQENALSVQLDESRPTEGTMGELVLESGVHVPILKQPIGSLDVVDMKSRTVVLSGWAADGAAKKAADRIVVFLDGAFLYAGPTGYAREDVAAAMGVPEIVNCGFTFEIPLPEKLGKKPDLRLFALFGQERAFEFNYSTKQIKASNVEEISFGKSVTGIAEEETSSAIIVREGTRIPLVKLPNFPAYVDLVSPIEDGLRIDGWALDPDTISPVMWIAVFVDNRFLSEVALSVPRDDVMKQLKEERYRMCGFRLTIPQSAMHEHSKIRLFAVRNSNEAVELKYPQGFITR